MKILFMGTPEFAVPSLERLLRAGHNICGVVTQPDKPVGRKKIITPPPVKVVALQYSVPVFQPGTLKDGVGLSYCEKLGPDVVVVVAYGQILPADMLAYPKLGNVNVHGSLLPEYRGAAPIQRAVLDDRSVTGITTMLMNEGLDTGDMLIKREVAIGDDETAPELFVRLADIGAQLLAETLAGLETGSIVPQKQDHSRATYAGMISKADSPICWERSAREIHCKVRGLYGWPSAETTLLGHTYKIHRTRMLNADLSYEAGPGEIVSLDPLAVRCGDGTALEILELQEQGGKRLGTADFLRGHSLNIGDTFL